VTERGTRSAAFASAGAAAPTIAMVSGEM